MALLVAPLVIAAVASSWLASRQQMVSVTTCENGALTIKCLNGTVIDITSSYYGRTPDTAETCNAAAAQLNSTCFAPGSSDVIANACQGRASCQIPVRDSFFNGKFCEDTAKVAHVDYACVDPAALPDPPGGVVQCEGATTRALLSCGQDYRVNVTRATFGRSNEVPDCGKSPAQRTDMACGVENNALQGVSKLCAKTRSCEFAVTTQSLGIEDPCPGTSKYLDANYTCVWDPLPSPTPSTQAADNERGNAACFPADAAVTLRDGSTVTMDSLAIGDEVLTTRESYDRVYFFSHRDPSPTTTFVRITAANATLCVSPNHYVRIPNGLAAARTMQPGDLVEHLTAGVVRVDAVERVRRRGLYAPHTMRGQYELWVDGFRVSELTTTVDPRAAKLLLSAVRAMYAVGIRVVWDKSVVGYSARALSWSLGGPMPL